MDVGGRPFVATTCPYCGVGCGVLARDAGDGTAAITGDLDHPANFGRLCSKGTALGETVSLEGRLLTPTVDGQPASWGAAIARVASAFAGTVAAHGPDSVALYVSGQLLTEDYYVANKLMKGFIGTANIDTNSRLCMASSVAGHKRAFGADTVPGIYEDLETADLLVLVGSNLAWCHPVLFQRVLAAKAQRPAMRIVVIDPRENATTAAADLHLAIAPESDVALFGGLLTDLAARGAVDGDYVARHTNGAEEALCAAAPLTVDAVAEATGVAAKDIATFYRWVAQTLRTVTVYSQGVNQSAQGSDKVNAIINTHLFTGRIGRPGMGPFSITGQPNAMGGREVGGLANMLAAHMDFADEKHRAIVQQHWASPVMTQKPGLKAVDLFEAIHEGRIKALWVMATNPSVTLPDAGRVDEALKNIPFLAVSDVVDNTDTLRHAHVALPAAAWGEKDGTVTNSERCISRQRRFLPLPGAVRPDWAIICDVAKQMGFAGFDYAGPHEIFDEHAALSARENGGTRDFDIGGLAGLSRSAYNAMPPTHWPQPITLKGEGPVALEGKEPAAPKDEGNAAPGTSERQAAAVGQTPATRFFANGGFFTPDRRGRLLPTPYTAPAGRAAPSARFPFTLNTGRVRDHWHTMTRTGRAPTLSAHLREPFAEIHPADAEANAILPDTLVRVENERGAITVRAHLTGTRRGSIFVPFHWNDATSRGGRVDILVAPLLDPVSGQPALKSASVAIAPFAAAYYGFAVTCSPVDPGAEYFARARLAGGYATEFASQTAIDEPQKFAEKLLATPQRLSRQRIGSERLGSERLGSQLIGVIDSGRQTYRFAAFDNGTLTGAVFLSPAPITLSRTFIGAALGERCGAAILAGRPPADQPDPGPTVCACFQVGENTILAAADAGAETVEAIGSAVNAGTNCGSCRGDIARLLQCHARTSEPQGETQSDDADVSAQTV